METLYGKLIRMTMRWLGITGGDDYNQRKQAQERQSFKLRLYNENAFRAMLTMRGIKILDVIYYNFNLFLSPRDRLFPKTAVYFSKNLEFLCRSMLKSLGTGYIVKCAK